MSESKVERGANWRKYFFVVTRLNATTTAAISIFVTLIPQAWPQTVQGSLEVHWDEVLRIVAQLRTSLFKFTHTIRKLLSCDRVCARVSKEISFTCSSGRIKRF